MDIIENWKFLMSRQTDADMKVALLKIHMGAFEDLRKNGHLIKVQDKLASEVAPLLSADERLELAGTIGRSMIDANAGGDLFNKTFKIQMADAFPNCIFIGMAAILENLDGGLNALFPEQKMIVRCEYTVTAGREDPLGQLLPLLEKCYSWVSVSKETQFAAPKSVPTPAPASASRTIPLHKTKRLFSVDKAAKVDTMRTAFSGSMFRGSIQKGDVLNVTDLTGNVLCRQGPVLTIYAKQGEEVRETDRLEEKQYAQELCLAVEIPAGRYNGLRIIEGDGELEELENGIKKQKKIKKTILIALILAVLGVAAFFGIKSAKESRYNSILRNIGTETMEKGFNNVYGDVVSFEPKYTAEKKSSSNNGIKIGVSQYANVICRCKTVEGTYFWLAIPAYQYSGTIEYLGNNKKSTIPGYSIGSFSNQYFSDPIRITGRMTTMESLADNVPASLSGELVLRYESYKMLNDK